MASRPSLKPVPTAREERTARALAALKQIAGSARRRLAKLHEQSDLSGAQLWALWQVKKSPGLTLQDLASVLGVHQSTASNLVEKLDSGGLVRKKRETADRRVVRLHVTAAGTQLLKKMPSPEQNALPEAMQQLTDEELRLLEQSLQLLTRKLGLEDPKPPVAGQLS